MKHSFNYIIVVIFLTNIYPIKLYTLNEINIDDNRSNVTTMFDDEIRPEQFSLHLVQDSSMCLRKCCPEGQMKVDSICKFHESANKTKLDIYDGVKFLKTSNILDFFCIVYGYKCPSASYSITQLDPEYDKDRYYLQEDGRLYLPHVYENDRYLDTNRYCVDSEIDEFNVGVVVFICSIDEYISCSSANYIGNIANFD